MAKAQPTFSLKDQLFNSDSLGDLADEFAAGVSGFDRDAFHAAALSGIPERSLMECLDWFADCIEPHLASDFPTMADQLEAAMPQRLDPSLRDDDFGRFIHAVPGVLAVRHGLEAHRERALDLLYEATQRFSMEFYIRAFLNRWPEETLARLEAWAADENYHVRRLVSEGTRPKLPWARKVELTLDQTLPLLDRLQADGTRFVTRSVANHLNDVAKTEPGAVLGRLEAWEADGSQDAKERAWMQRHALRTLVKDGHPGAMAMLGYRGDAPVDVSCEIATPKVVLGDALEFAVTLNAPDILPVLVDYRIRFARPNGKSGEKVFKLKVAEVKPGKPLVLKKVHKLKANATTFELHPGVHGLVVQVNGVDRAEASFEIV
ncbi:DNA alkylation repair protein [Tateyamaria omphalii]|uniref:DNA alkylation repair protein n=1 Tax=Tateyamaria omphalii TaxID=299262 RepID=UPI001C996448|nr:DNA alkylation repair protein [Tateyamaria omphalii]MBY5932263.1 DNA alkylation repair protein [Tateyamaria omphalii]